MKQLRTYVPMCVYAEGCCGAFAITEMLLIAIFAQPFNIRQGCLRKYQVLLVLIIYLIFCIDITSSRNKSREMKYLAALSRTHVFALHREKLGSQHTQQQR